MTLRGLFVLWGRSPDEGNCMLSVFELLLFCFCFSFYLFIYCQSLVLGPEGAKHELPPCICACILFEEAYINLCMQM